MNSEYERLNELLEREKVRTWPGEKQPEQFGMPAHISPGDAEIDELVMVARRLQVSPQVQVDPTFAILLEGRLLQRQASLHRERVKRGWFFPRLWRMHPVFSVALSFCFLLLVLAASVLAAAAQVSNPQNPLYLVKHWEQGMQVSLAGTSQSRAELDVQFARERLNTLADLADPAQADAYRQALMDFDQQLSTATNAIQDLSPGSAHDRLSSELAALKVDARRELQGFLPQLALAERLVTTDELGRLGDTVPHLQSVEITLQEQANERTATIDIGGDDLQPGAHLLVDGQVLDARGFFQNGLLVFTIVWNGDQQPQSIGILNPDGTVAQTNAMTMKGSNGNGNGNSNNGNNGGHGNGNNNGRPDKTPTPHH